MVKIYIFGAHSRGQTTAAYLEYLYPYIKIEAYLYDNDETNPDIIGDIPVLKLEGDLKNPDGRMSVCTCYPVCIGTRGIYHSRITEHLKQMGFEKIYPVTVELDQQLRNAYLKKYYIHTGRRFPRIDELENQMEKSAAVYVVRSVSDRPLRQPYALASYEKEIQAGAALTKERLSEKMMTDDVGNHISVRNRQFCELTVLYWIWKNAQEDIVGLAHYRRHFILPGDWTESMDKNKLDVILPVPLYVAPSVADNYRSRHDEADWESMMGYLKLRNEAEYEKAKRFFDQNLYSPCNMFIMKKEVLCELCGWLFPVIFHVAEYVGEKEDGYQNRYPGFLSERLISFFFEKNRSRYKVIYADKNFLE